MVNIDNQIRSGKIEFMIIAFLNVIISILLGFVTIFLIPLLYIIMFYSLYKGHGNVRWLLVVINLISAFSFSSLPIYNNAFAECLINIAIPLILVISVLLIFKGKTKHFIKYKLQVHHHRNNVK